MAKSHISEEKYRVAVRLSQDIEDSLALTIGKFDPARMPKLTFTNFPVTSAIAAVSPDSSFLFLKSAIDKATTSLILYIYDVSAPYLLDLLAAAKGRGVKIRAMWRWSGWINPRLGRHRRIRRR